MKHKEEMARVNASQALVDAANKLENPFEPLIAFRKYNRNGLELEIACQRVTEMKAEDVDWAFDLTKRNMETLYEESDWGWNDKRKREEMTDDNAWYLIARNSQGGRQALCEFRFELDENMEEVIYCYEIQIEPSLQHKGVGKFLMQILELIGHKCSMKKIVLTVFKENTVGYKFFTDSLKYEIDETAPSKWDPTEEFCYEILSKPLKKKTTAEQIPPTQQGNSANGKA
ncbi:predicted protein [Nematostella vectensis]|uniref:N-alpha-acetyltransferase 40 n=1 Tax=Nematostella vectensis TaxID=45351 RepID=A7SV95_NEMVE|nr:predicted protein [Nematostella vectensis]|eukprot:XP_001624471.1 predicted protein [Nematostella vectensis]